MSTSRSLPALDVPLTVVTVVTVFAVFTVLALRPTSAHAQGGPLAPGPTASTSALGSTPESVAAEAKRYFEHGEMLRAGAQYLPALEAYMKSRALLPRASNTLNAAVCLFNLGRYDEALELYEEALTKYPEDQLPAAVRESAKKIVAQIEPKVGRLDVSANVDGSLVIDGRQRGKLPQLAAARVMPGKHVVRVLREGFATFEQAVEVSAGGLVRIDAKLEALAAAGRLRVAGDAELEGATLLVDGAPIALLPWEGTLQPGPHVVQAVKGDVGTAPTLANVVVSQTVTVSLAASPLAAEQRIILEPPSAVLSIDGVATGKGSWEGRLPVGTHVIEARELGFFSARIELRARPGDHADVHVVLQVDAEHPRWGAEKGRFVLELESGWSIGARLGDDASCAAATLCASRAPAGAHVSLGGGYELPSGLGAFASLGWTALSRSLTRSEVSQFRPRGSSGLQPATFDLVDPITMSGPTASLGVGYRLRFGAVFDVALRVSVGAAFLTTHSDQSGTATGGGRTLAVTTTNSGDRVRKLMLSVGPEVMLGANFGPLRFAAGVAIPVQLLDGPTLPWGDTRVVDPGQDCAAHPASIDCSGGFALGKAYGWSRFVAVMPQASIGYRF